MRVRIEKPRSKGEAAGPTPDRAPQGSPTMTAKMHFHAVHNAGEQLRRGAGVRTGRKHDRIVGR
jgi:hypothetical protein